MAGKKTPNSPVGSPSEDTETGGNVLDNASFKDQDRFLPIANVSRIMKKALPTNAKISKEAKETVQECVSEFISFITGEASDKCQREKRKTINGEDLLWAMTTLGFENYVGPLKTHLSKYRDTEEEKNSMARQGDQSPTDVSVTDNISVSTKAAITSTTTVSQHHRHQSIHGDMNFPGISNGFLSLGPLGIQSSFGDQVVYGENSNRNGGFYMSTSYDNGDNKNTNNQNGILWY